MSVRLGKPTVSIEEDRAIYRVAVEGLDGGDQLWFSVPAEYAHMINARADAAVIALVQVAMRVGRNLTVEGTLTDDVRWAVAGEAQAVLRGTQPILQSVTIDAPDTAPALPRVAGVATGYSAGVDSYAVLQRYLLKEGAPEGQRVTHLLYNNVGSHGHAEEGAMRFHARLTRIRRDAEGLGCPLIDVDSNLDAFYLPNRVGFLSSSTVRNAAVAHLLAQGIGRYLYASSVSYDVVGVRPRASVAATDPILLPLLSTTALTLTAANTDMDRVQKTALVAELAHAQQHLDVCIGGSGERNCGDCWKCLRTMLTLDLLGHLDAFRDVFPAPADTRWREKHVIWEMQQPGQNSHGVVALYATRHRIGPTLQARVAASRAQAWGARAQAAVQRRLPRRRNSA